MSQIPSNPNLTKNRIPSERELGSLRELALQKKEVIDDLVEKAASARTKHAAIKNEYKSQLAILEEIESNLHLTKEHAESFEKAAETLGGEMSHLHGLIHPIRRATDDTLRMIFESVVSGSGESFFRATQLSHVCQRWRNIAISSPRLWSDCVLEASQAYCTPRSKSQAFLRRVKKAEATLTILVDVEDVAIQDVVRSIDNWPLFELSLMRNISIWEISVISARDESCSPILRAVTRSPSRALDCLRLNIHTPTIDSIIGFISKFPQVRKLELVCAHLAPSNPPCVVPSFSNLSEVLFSRIGDIYILGILGTMPKLQTLRIRDCRVGVEPNLLNADIVLCDLDIFEFSAGINQDYFPWRQIKCPKLTQLELNFGDENLHDEIYSFVSVTTSITDMNIFKASSEVFLNLARIAPQLRRLCTWSYAEMAVLARWQRFGLDDPPFPNLLHLEPQMWCYKSPVTDLLDDIIHTRCLPRAHSAATTDATVFQVLDAFSIRMLQASQSQSFLALLEKHFSTRKEGSEIIHDFVG